MVSFFSACVERILRLFSNFHLHRKFLNFFEKQLYCKAVEVLNIFEKLSWLEGYCFEEILWLFTNFYLHRNVSIFLRNDSECKDVDLYNTRMRYAIIESLDLMRNISWLASCFSKIKRPNKHCTENQSVSVGVHILTWFPIFILKKYSDLNFNLWICAVQEKDTK